MLEEVLSKLLMRKNYETDFRELEKHKKSNTCIVTNSYVGWYVTQRWNTFLRSETPHLPHPHTTRRQGCFTSWTMTATVWNTHLLTLSPHTTRRQAGLTTPHRQWHGNSPKHIIQNIFLDSKLAKQFSSTCSLYDHDRNVPHMPLSYSKILTSPWLFVLRTGAGAWSFRWAVWLVAYHLHVAE